MDSILTIETHAQQSRMDLAKHALVTLNKHFPGMNWGVMCLGLTTIRITERRFLQWGGAQMCMSVHDTDWSSLLEFEAICVKYAGELLERGNLARNSRIGNQEIKKLPDGFLARLAPNHKERKIKMVGPNGESIEQMIKNSHTRMKTEGYSNTSSSIIRV